MNLERKLRSIGVKRLLKSVARDMLPYAALDFRIPSGLQLSVPDRGAWSSLSEVFLMRVYDPFYRHLGEVRHWVDLGCNNGFFSFGLLDAITKPDAPRPETSAFLGDANAVCVTRVREAIARNQLQTAWNCEQVIVGPPGATVRFKRHKDSLHSNIYDRGHGRRLTPQATTNITERLAKADNLFDLIKIDIEGAEQFLFGHHLEFLKRFRCGLCEWHAPHFPGLEMKERLRQLNWRVLEVRAEGVEPSQRPADPWKSSMGTVLWENTVQAR